MIPARYSSSRLPGKSLADIHGKTMIQHVYEKACQVPGIEAVVVATDDQRIADVVDDFGGKALMTSADHQSGTERLVEVMEAYESDIYINLQGDEPLVRPEDVSILSSQMASDSSIKIGTLCHSISAEEAANPNNVKIVLSDNGDALYFSRCPIPYPRDQHQSSYLKHIGIYGYRKHVLEAYSDLREPDMEKLEKLEQLRFLNAGYQIRAYKVEPVGPGVDTPECLEKVRMIIGNEAMGENFSLEQVKLVITDVDGVLTDGSLYYDEQGESLKRFHVRDGLGMRMLEEIGVRVAVVSGRDSSALRKRVADLGLSRCRFGVQDKATACIEIMNEHKVLSKETVYVGDDSIDLPAFSVCGYSFAVADAPVYVKELATKTLASKGGEGAFRELADEIIHAHKKSLLLTTADGYASKMNRFYQ